MAKRMRIKTITKSYGRKISLRGVTSQYDNIEHGTFQTAEVEYETEEELQELRKELAVQLRKDVEEDIKNSIAGILAMKLDPKNSVLLGLGFQEKTKEISNETEKEVSEDDVTDQLGLKEDIEIPKEEELGEVDLDEFNFEDFVG